MAKEKKKRTPGNQPILTADSVIINLSDLEIRTEKLVKMTKIFFFYFFFFFPSADKIDIFYSTFFYCLFLEIENETVDVKAKKKELLNEKQSNRLSK